VPPRTLRDILIYAAHCMAATAAAAAALLLATTRVVASCASLASAADATQHALVDREGVCIIEQAGSLVWAGPCIPLHKRGRALSGLAHFGSLASSHNALCTCVHV
jgi:hypothetical protein